MKVGDLVKMKVKDDEGVFGPPRGLGSEKIGILMEMFTDDDILKENRVVYRIYATDTGMFTRWRDEWEWEVISESR